MRRRGRAHLTFSAVSSCVVHVSEHAVTAIALVGISITNERVLSAAGAEAHVWRKARTRPVSSFAYACGTAAPAGCVNVTVAVLGVAV